MLLWSRILNGRLRTRKWTVKARQRTMMTIRLACVSLLRSLMCFVSTNALYLLFLSAISFHWFADRTTNTYYMRQSDVYSNAALVRGGCLGTAPLFPSTAFSLRTLEVYRQTHRVCPRVSIQAEVRMLCHLHRVSFLHCLWFLTSDILLIRSLTDARSPANSQLRLTLTLRSYTELIGLLRRLCVTTYLNGE
jgi:hypothetical protein